MITVNDVFDFLNEKYPVEDACDFDNVGILVGDKNNAVTKALVALDCDITTVKEAVKIGAELIITHHPVIFVGVKSVVADSVVFELLRNNISVISMHTNYDVGANGLNDILCEKLGFNSFSKFVASDGYKLNAAETDISSADELAKDIKQKLSFSVRYVGGRPIKKLLVCSGSGGGFVEDAIKCGFDGLVTADVKHNQFVDAVNAGISLFDAGHYATETICVEHLSKIISQKFKELNIQTFYQKAMKYI